MADLLARHIRQFRPLVAARLILAGVARRLFDPDSRPTYARGAEDRIAIGLLGGAGDVGFFVDVGCNAPVKASNTFELYRRGWRGLTVDASETLVNEHRRVRPRDRSVVAAVSNREGEAEFIEFELSTVSTLSRAHAEHWQQLERVTRTRKVRTTTLTALCEQNGVPPRFDLLSIDVEGHDLEALSSLDLERFRPRLIIIEMLGADALTAPRHAITVHLHAAGYQLVAFALDNGYFSDVRDRADGEGTAGG